MSSANPSNDYTDGRPIWLEQTQEAADCCSTLGFLLALQNNLPGVSQPDYEAFGRAALRLSWFLTQEMLLDPATSAEIVREFIREWVKK